MVKFVVKVVGFMLLLAFLVGFLGKCGGSGDAIVWLQTANTEVTEINQTIEVSNTTNVNIIQDIDLLNVKIDEYNLSINNENNLIKKTSVNQNTLINWFTENNTYISILEHDYQLLLEKITLLRSDANEIHKLNERIKSLEKELRENKKKWNKYVNENRNSTTINEEIKVYVELERKLTVRIAELKKELAALRDELNETNKKFNKLEKSLEECVNQLTKLNKKLEKLMGNNKEDAKPEDVSYYYIIDTQEVLASKDILYSVDANSDVLVVNPNPDNAHFARLTDKNLSLTLGKGKDKFKVLSNMPADSYEIKVINKKKVLVIKDVKKFWSKTDYLIIVRTE